MDKINMILGCKNKLVSKKNILIFCLMFIPLLLVSSCVNIVSNRTTMDYPCPYTIPTYAPETGSTVGLTYSISNNGTANCRVFVRCTDGYWAPEAVTGRFETSTTMTRYAYADEGEADPGMVILDVNTNNGGEGQVSILVIPLEDGVNAQYGTEDSGSADGLLKLSCIAPGVPVIEV